MYRLRQRHNLHKGPAHEADANHKGPAGDNTQAIDGIADGDKEAIFRQSAVRRVQETLIGGNVIIPFLAVDLEDVFRGNGGGVQRHAVESGCRAFLADLSLGNTEVPHRGSTSTPGRTQDLVVLAVQISEVRRFFVGSEQGDRLLALSVRSVYWHQLPSSLTLNAFSARPQRPKQVLFPPVMKRSQSCASDDGSRVDCQLLRRKGVTAFSGSFSATFWAGTTGVADGMYSLALLNHP